MAIGQAIQAASPLGGHRGPGLSNGCSRLHSHRRRFAEGGYEVDTAFKSYGTLMVTPACERMIVDARARLSQQPAAVHRNHGSGDVIRPPEKVEKRLDDVVGGAGAAEGGPFQDTLALVGGKILRPDHGDPARWR